MYKLLGCIAQQHDWRLLVLAGFVCCLSGIAAIHLFRRAHSTISIQVFWLVAAGLVTGTGIWATHFIAMLAYQPGVEMAYDILLTVYSLLATISDRDDALYRNVRAANAGRDFLVLSVRRGFDPIWCRLGRGCCLNRKPGG
jgi:NO-binding membrane sensor protein with MHYT domain